MKLYKTIKIKSYFVDLKNDAKWNEVLLFLENNSDNFKYYKVSEKKIKKAILKEYGTLAVGGFTETIFITIICGFVVELSKGPLRLLLKNIGRLIKKKYGTIIKPSEVGYDDIKIILTFANKKPIKKLEINIPLMVYDKKIETINFRIIQKQFEILNKVSLKFNFTTRKYEILIR